jgi:protein SCO1/2
VRFRRFWPVLLLTGCAKHYTVDGLVLRVEREKQTVVVSHNAIPRYMPAMAMPFRVRRAAELDGLAAGERVNFQLVVHRGQSFARSFRALAEDGTDTIRLAPVAEKVAVGDPLPDFGLIDQSSRPVRLSDFRGKVVAVNFIYTRCPLPDVCPRLSANFARVQKRFGRRLGAELMLLSVTLDPQYDTPEVLTKYAKIWRANPEGWRFLTGDLREIQGVAGRFGMVYWPEEGLMTHTSQTCVVARDGRLAALVAGSSYSAAQLGDLIELELEDPR